MSRAIALALAVACSLAGAAAAQSFHLVGFPPFSNGSTVNALSADGQVAAGGALVGATPGFTWTPAAGRYDFGFEPGVPASSIAYGISPDGTTAVGQSLLGAYRWRGPGTFQNLGHLYAGATVTTGTDASQDGDVVVGRSEAGGGFYSRAFRWTPNGMTNLGVTRPEHGVSAAKAVSADGSRVCGISFGGEVLGLPACDLEQHGSESELGCSRLFTRYILR